MASAKFDYKGRCERIQQRLQEAGMDYLLVGPSSDMLYLIGLHRPQSERLNVLMIPKEGTIRILLPSFEQALVEPLATFFDYATWDETEDPTAKFASLLPNGGQGLRIGVADKMFVHFQYALQAAAPGAEFCSGGEVMNPIRMIKEPMELDYLTQVGAAADRTYEALLQQPLIGMNEIDAKALLMTMMPQYGHDAGGGAIVCVGENCASPHHHPSAREVSAGDAIITDFGGTIAGYWSDMTRSFHIGEPSAEYLKVYDIVNEANRIAFEAIKPGVTAESIDKIARDYITDAGYGEYFLHRTGHGLGSDIHEPPYIVGGDKTVLQEGMVFSVEPGIYIRGKFGVRIEDIVTVTADGARRFNLSSHDLRIIEA